MSLEGSVAITGLDGFLGRRVAERLLGFGSGVRVIGLDRFRPKGLPRGLQFRRLDLSRPGADERLADILHKEGVEVVAHFAFRRDPSPDREADHELETVGSLHTIAACAAARVRRLVVSSSTMLYGARPDNPAFLDEGHPLRGHPAAHNIENRCEVERLLAEWTGRHPEVEVCVLRHCWLMGPSYRDRVTDHFSSPLVLRPLGYDPMLQFLHESDCVDAFAEAVAHSHPGIFNLVGRGALPLSRPLPGGQAGAAAPDARAHASAGRDATQPQRGPARGLLRLSPLLLRGGGGAGLGGVRRAALLESGGLDVLRLVDANETLRLTSPAGGPRDARR